MAKLVVVKGDPVEGTDTHNVTGSTRYLATRYLHRDRRLQVPRLDH